MYASYMGRSVAGFSGHMLGLKRGRASSVRHEGWSGTASGPIESDSFRSGGVSTPIVAESCSVPTGS